MCRAGEFVYADEAQEKVFRCRILRALRGANSANFNFATHNVNIGTIALQSMRKLQKLQRNSPYICESPACQRAESLDATWKNTAISSLCFKFSTVLLKASPKDEQPDRRSYSDGIGIFERVVYCPTSTPPHCQLVFANDPNSSGTSSSKG